MFNKNIFNKSLTSTHLTSTHLNSSQTTSPNLTSPFSTLPSESTPYPMLILVGPNGMYKHELILKLVEEFPDYFGLGFVK